MKPIYQKGDILKSEKTGQRLRVLDPILGDNDEFYGFYDVQTWNHEQSRFCFVSIDIHETELTEA